jgi:hypothetical protein
VVSPAAKYNRDPAIDSDNHRMLSVGTRLGPYEIESLIGTGGMGSVYKAVDTRLQRVVAIKQLGAGVCEWSDDGAIAASSAMAGAGREDAPAAKHRVGA